MRFLIGSLLAIVVGGALLLFGTISPCGMLKEAERKQESVAAVLPDALLDLAMAAKYGSLTPGKCVGLLLQTRNGSPVPPNTVEQPARPTAVASIAPQSDFQDAMLLASRIMDDCRDRRLRGELKTRFESVQCSIPRVRQTFADVNYPYMDLIDMMNRKRIEIARKQDQGQMTEEQATIEGQALLAQLGKLERTRDVRRK